MADRPLTSFCVLLTTLLSVGAFVHGVGANETLQVGDRTFVKNDGTWYLQGDFGRTQVHPNRLTVRFCPTAEPGLRASFMDSLGLELHRQGPGDIVHLAVPGNLEVPEAFAICRSRQFIAFAEPVLIGHYCRTPSDGLWTTNKQWSLMDNWQDFESAWEIETGDTSIVVAILDSGVNIDHSDLRGNLWRNWAETPGNGIDDDGNSLIDDHWGWDFYRDSGTFRLDGHGSWVTGLVCATTNNDTVGIAGPAGGWCEASWQPGDRGNGVRAMALGVGDPTSAAVGDALAYAISQGAAVANMSLTLDGSTYVDSMIQAAADSGLVICAASGNTAYNRPNCVLQYPASDTLTIAVGAVYRNDVRTHYSDCGSGIDVVASSGACLYDSSCDYSTRDNCDTVWGDDYPGCTWYPLSAADSSSMYSRMSGTSAACPQVSALAALLLSMRPELSRTQVRHYIRHSAEDQVGDATDSLGYDIYYGYGRINAYAALFLARGGGEMVSDLTLCHDVRIDRDVKVAAGTTLTILPGVDVTFTAGSDSANLGVDSARCELIVEGTLLVEGTSGNPVTFTSTGGSVGDWYGIRVLDGGVIDLDHCRVEEAYKGISGDDPQTFVLTNLEIEDCVTHGIYCEGCDETTEIEGCTIESPGFVGIEVREGDSFSIKGNEITDATAYGIKCTESTDLTVDGNTVLGAEIVSGFVGIYYKPATGDTTYTIKNNHVYRCGSRGIACEGGAASSALVESNDVSDDGYARGSTGIYFYGSEAKMRRTKAEKKASGVVVQGGSTTPKKVPDLGQDVSGEEGNNQFLDVSTWYIFTDLTPSDPVVKAEWNWHGISPPDQNKFGRQVDWVPYLTDEPEGGRGSPPADGGEERPVEYALSQNWPNPFNPVTSLRYGMPEAGDVALRVYDAAGRLVRTLVDGEKGEGYHEETWDGTDDAGVRLGSGVYFAKLEVNGAVRTQKLVLLK